MLKVLWNQVIHIFIVKLNLLEKKFNRSSNLIKVELHQEKIVVIYLKFNTEYKTKTLYNK